MLLLIAMNMLRETKRRRIGTTLVVRCALLVLATVALIGCGGVSRSARVEPVTATTPVMLSPGDVIRISFINTPEMNQAQKIRADGTITLPGLGAVRVSGKTLTQLEAYLKQLYSKQVNDTELIVTLDSAAIECFVVGSVRSPGKLAFDRATTILQAIMQAGGPNPFGNLRSVHVIRMSNGVEQTQLVDLRPTLAGRPTKPFYVKNGDIIQVPQSPF